MNEDNITRLVVGEKYTLSMGVPVGQAIKETDVSKTLRWRDGRWESNNNLLTMAKQLTSRPSKVLNVPAKKNRPIVSLSMRRLPILVSAVAAIVAAGWVAAMGYSHFFGQSQEVALPIGVSERAVAIGNAVKSVDQPYPMPTAPAEVPETPASISAAEPVPVVQPKEDKPVANQQQPKPAQPPAPAKTPEPAIAGQKSDAKDQKQQPAAVILDAETPAAKQAQSGGTPLVTAKPAQDNKVGAGLVAITPEGKYALFTNVKTRLPEKFAVGDKLPSGETVKSIDKNAGKVTTDAKEYRLE